MHPAKSALEQIIHKLLTKQINTSWYHRIGEDVILTEQVNPINEEREMQLKEYEKIQSRYFSRAFLTTLSLDTL